MLKIKNFSLYSKDSEGKKLLDNVSFEVGENEIHCILGKNGSGKSTLSYSLMGLPRYGKSEGSIIFDGQNIIEKKSFERAKLGITLAFQEPARFDGLLVRDFLQAGAPNANDDDLRKVMDLVGIDFSKFIDRVIDDKLSGGERKRIELASVIIMKPRLMILDEPDASLDILVYNELYDLMLRIKKEIACSILLITHREEAGLIADKATLIEGGRIILSGRFRQVMREYCGREGRRERCLNFKKNVRL